MCPRLAVNTVILEIVITFLWQYSLDLLVYFLKISYFPTSGRKTSEMSWDQMLMQCKGQNNILVHFTLVYIWKFH